MLQLIPIGSDAGPELRGARPTRFAAVAWTSNRRHTRLDVELLLGAGYLGRAQSRRWTSRPC